MGRRALRYSVDACLALDGTKSVAGAGEGRRSGQAYTIGLKGGERKEFPIRLPGNLLRDRTVTKARPPCGNSRGLVPPLPSCALGTERCAVPPESPQGSPQSSRQQEPALRITLGWSRDWTLPSFAEPRWRASFVEIETILGFSLPDSARIHRPWWANPGAGGGHSHALAWRAAGWKTRLVDLGAEELVFERIEGPSVSAATPTVPPVDELLPPRDFGPWP